MNAMCLRQPGEAVAAVEMATPMPGPRQLLIEILACGVCRTDLYLIDGELPDIHYPIVPGHEIVGRAVECGRDARASVPWLASTCGYCEYCTTIRENLCDLARFTGHSLDGDYAQFAKIAAEVKLDVNTEPFALEQANEALNRLRAGRIEGAAVLDIAR